MSADGFDAPVGTLEQRSSAELWPGTWFDATGFAAYYTAVGAAYHTGADLNNNTPSWDMDRGAPVYAPASGLVTFAGVGSGTWGQMIVIRHDPLPDGTQVWTRCAHLGERRVETGQRVERGQQIATIGNADGKLNNYHLHYDIAQTDILERSPGHWPGINRDEVLRHYVDPLAFTASHRPGLVDAIEEGDMADLIEARARIDAARQELDAAEAALEGEAGKGTAPPVTAVVTSTLRLNVRKGAGTQYGAVGSLPPGTQVTVLETKLVNGVTWVRHDGGPTPYAGWSSGEWLGFT